MVKSNALYTAACMIIIVAFPVFSEPGRLAGMGDLTLLFQDDYDRLDLFDFAGVSAGFFRNDTVSSVGLRGSFLRERWQNDSLVYVSIGQAVPEQLLEYATLEAVSFYEVIPEFDLTPCEVVYTSRKTGETYDMFGQIEKPTAWGVRIGYNQMSREDMRAEETDRLRTPSVYVMFGRPLSSMFDFGMTLDAFYGAYGSADGNENISFFPFGGGVGIAYHTDRISVGVNADYHYPIFSYSGPYGDERFNGHALSPILGAVVTLQNVTWATAVDVKWVNLAGSSDGEPMGDLDIMAYSARSQVLFTPSIARFACMGQYVFNQPRYTNEGASDPWFETSYMNYAVAGGGGIDLQLFRAGVEAVYQFGQTDDHVYDDQVRSSDIGIKGGAEFNPFSGLFLRAGYLYHRFDPDLDDIIDESDNITTNTITAGVGLKISEYTRVDCAYNYKMTDYGVVPFYTDEEVTDHIVFLYLKHMLVSREY